MKALRLGAVTLVIAGLAACGGSGEPAAVAPPGSAKSESAGTTTAPASADGFSKDVVADAVQFQPEAARVDGNALVSTGAPGFVIYGPYVSLTPGKYHVTVQGSIAALKPGAQVRFDAVSGGATAIHGEQVVTTTMPDAGTIANFDITIPDGVADLEVRAEVTEGVDMRIESYKVVKAD